MRKIIFFLSAICLSVNTFGQPYPDCNDLQVESINMSDELSITIRNTCYDCSYGLMGCLYSEMKIVRTVAPFDTIAASDCYCLNWEDPNINGDLQTFLLNTNVAFLPPLADLQVQMIGCGCDTIPLSQALLNITPNSKENNYFIFPNPAKNEIHISNLSKGSTLRITDITGKILYSTITDNEQKTINITSFATGIYIVNMEDNGTIINKKFIVNK